MLLGAALLLLSQFTTLYQVHTATSTLPVRSVGAGANHGYALVPIAALAAGLAIATMRSGERAALLAVGALGVVALLIVLLADLPESRASGLLGPASTHHLPARTSPGTGLYLESLGAVLLIASCGLGLLMPRRSASRPGTAGT